jgi:hypothetical protein
MGNKLVWRFVGMESLFMICVMMEIHLMGMDVVQLVRFNLAGHVLTPPAI